MSFDLAIAIGVLAAAGKVPRRALDGVVFVGELTLDGRLRAVPGVLPMMAAQAREMWCVVVPEPRQRGHRGSVHAQYAVPTGAASQKTEEGTSHVVPIHRGRRGSVRRREPLVDVAACRAGDLPHGHIGGQRVIGPDLLRVFADRVADSESSPR